jgi:hypothetical protein
MFLQDIWQLHELPNTIILDCRKQFSSDFWQQLYTGLQIQLWLSTGFHLKTNGQIKCVNAVLQQ